VTDNQAPTADAKALAACWQIGTGDSWTRIGDSELGRKKKGYTLVIEVLSAYVAHALAVYDKQVMKLPSTDPLSNGGAERTFQTVAF